MWALEATGGGMVEEMELPSLGCGDSPPPPHYIAYLAVSPYVEGTYNSIESTIIPHMASRAFDSQASLQLSSPISHNQLRLPLSPRCHFSEHTGVQCTLSPL